MQETDLQDAAEVIDSLLGDDDGSILAAMAYYKSSLLTLFGRDGIVSMLREAVETAPHVAYFSQRSRREIDPIRPTVNLRVDHEKALAENEQLKSEWGMKSYEDEKDLLSLKAMVIHTEVCRTMTTKMNGVLAPHWEKAKAYAGKNQAMKQALNEKALKLILCTMFSIRVSPDVSVPPVDRMCTLQFFV